MDLVTFQKQRELRLREEPKFREICWTCRQPDFSCFCSWVKPFDPQIDFVILMHPVEFKRRIATGRLSHLSLKNSQLIVGEDYSLDSKIWDLVEDDSRQNVILYPGQKSVNLTPLNESERAALIEPDRKLTVFVIDGTWATARKMVRLSINLHTLPRICFTPPAPSNFRVRKQPNVNCFSTIEAVHHTIELLGPAVGFANENRETDSLLDTFDKMVQRQLELAHTNLHKKRT